MDHLILPHDPICPLPLCPLLCDPNTIAECRFDQYPLLAAPKPYWQRSLHRDQRKFRNEERASPSRTADLESFLQAWLFFCLWKNLLNGVVEFAVSDHVHVVDGMKVVRTHILTNDHLGQWHRAMNELPHPERTITISKFNDWLSLYNHALEATREHPTFNSSLLLSLKTLLEVLNTAVWDQTDAAAPRYTFGSLIDFSELERTQMLKNGWCPFEVMATGRMSGSKSLSTYLCNMKRTDTAAVHAQCNDNLCSAATIDMSRYKPRHVHSDCSCEMVSPKPGAVETCLSSNTYPILKLTSKGDIEVVPFVKGLHYIALSHCWADGLGNPANMSLPRCQLRRLAALVHKFHGQQFIERRPALDTSMPLYREYTEDRTLHFWCDTICCPVEGPLKLRAISRLKDVYRNAAYGLVLERSLEAYHAPQISALEITMRILTSKWIFRGWTMQEAGLPKKLVFKFAERLIEHEALMNVLAGYWEQHPGIRPQLNRAQAELRALRSWFDRPSDEEDEHAVPRAMLNFSNRRLSVASDEALCLSTVLNVNGDAVAYSATRMETLWKLFSETKHGIPQTMIFNTLPRLNSPGYGWAPRTLIGADNSLRVSLGSIKDVKGKVTRHGLLVKGRAWSVCKAYQPFAFRWRPAKWLSAADRHGCTLLRVPSGEMLTTVAASQRHCLQTSKPCMADLLGARTCHLVFQASGNDQSSQPKPYRTGWSALLTYCAREQDSIAVLRSIWPIRVSRTDRVQWYRLADHGVRSLQKSWLARCLDGIAACEHFCFLLINHSTRNLRFLRTRLRALKTVRAIVERHIEPCIRIVASIIHREFYAAQGNIHDRRTAQDIGGLAFLMVDLLLGNFAEVVETFPESRQWYID